MKNATKLQTNSDHVTRLNAERKKLYFTDVLAHLVLLDGELLQSNTQAGGNKRERVISITFQCFVALVN